MRITCAAIVLVNPKNCAARELGVIPGNVVYGNAFDE